MRFRVHHKIKAYWYWGAECRVWGWRCRCGSQDGCWASEEYAYAAGLRHIRWSDD